jgi:hypothetical protein
MFMLSLALALVLAMPRVARADLVVNGGFETGDFTGWTQSGNTGFTEVLGSFNGFLPHSGNYQARFGPVGSLGYIEQTLNTTAGAHYVLSFWLANPGLGLPPNEFYVALSGVGFSDFVDVGLLPYTQFTAPFTATTASTVLTFGFQNDPDWFYLDDVSVAPVPEPSSLAALGLLGIAALGLWRRKA